MSTLLVTNMHASTYSGRSSVRRRQKDPSKSPTIDSTGAWVKLDQSPPKAIENAISPKIVEYDRSACETIISKMNQEKQLNQLSKDYQSYNR